MVLPKPSRILSVLVLGLLCVAPVTADVTMETRDVTDDGKPDLVIDQGTYKLVLEPSRGAKITSFIYQGHEWVKPEGSHGDGLFKVAVMPMKFRGDFFDHPFQYRVVQKKPDRLVIEFKRTGEVGDLRFIEMTIRYTFLADEPAIRADYRMHNIPRSQIPLRLGMWFHNMVFAPELELTTVFPTVEGIETHEAGATDGGAWYKKPVRGWAGVVDTGRQLGGVFTIDYRHLEMGLNWYSKRPGWASVEFGFFKTPIPHGQSFETSMTFVPFKGLKAIDGAGHDVVGQLVPGDGSVTVKVVSGSARTLKLAGHVAAPDKPDQPLATLDEKTLALKPGQVASVELPLKGTDDGLVVVKLVGEDNEVARLERPVGAAEGKPWTMMPLKKQLIPPKPDYFIPPLADVLEQPHRDYMTPAADGSLEAFFLVALDNQRQIVDFADRFDVTYRRTPIGGRPKHMFEFRHQGRPADKAELPDTEAKALLVKALKKPVPVIVYGGQHIRKGNFHRMQWKDLPGAAQKGILQKVRGGTGLVYLYPGGLSDEASKALLGGKEIGPEHYIRNWASPGVTPMDRRVKITVKEYGKGRVVIFSGWYVGLLPYECTYRTDPVQLSDYHYGLLYRAMRWAARRDETPGFDSVERTEKGVVVKAAEALRGRTRVPWTVVNDRDETVASGTSDVAGNAVEINPTLPARRSRYFLHLELADDKAVHDMAVVELPHEQSTIIEKAELPTVVKIGDNPLALDVAGPDGKKLTLDLTVRTLQGDVYWHKTVEVAPGKVALAVTVPELPTLSGRLRLDLLDGDTLLDRRDLEVNLPEKVHAMRERFMSILWGSFGFHTAGATSELAMKQLRSVGFDAYLSTFAGYSSHKFHTPQVMMDHNLATHLLGFRRVVMRDRTILYEYQKTGNLELLHRKPCLAAPEYHDRMMSIIDRMFQEFPRFGVLMYGYGDEMAYTYEGGETPIDICFDPHTLALMRPWLKEKYGDLATLNRQWGSTFKTWDDVTPTPFDKLPEGDAYGPWFEHRLFSDVQYNRHFLKKYADVIRKRDPGALVGVSGVSLQMLAYGGYNVPLQMEAYNGYIPYGRPYLAAGLAWKYPQSLRTCRWIGYNRPPVQIRWQVWRDMMYGARGIGYWWAHHILNPDLTVAEPGRDIQDIHRQLKRGLGDLLVKSTRQTDGVAMLYSQSSIVGAYALQNRGMDSYKLFRSNMEGWMDAVIATGLQPRLVTEEDLDKLTEKVLILPMSVSISDAAAASIRRYVEAGGIVIGDGLVGVMNGFGRVGKAGQLDEVFGIRRTDAPEINQAGGVVKLAGGALGLPTVDLSATVVETGIEANGAKALARMVGKRKQVGGLNFSRGAAGGQAFYHNRLGKGQALYLGVVGVTLSDARRHSILVDLFDAAGVDRPVRVSTRRGKLLEHLHVNRFEVGPVTLVALGEDPMRIPNASIARLTVDDLEKHAREVTVSIGRPVHWYDCVAGRYLGRGESVDWTMLPASGNILAAVPMELGKLVVERVAVDAGRMLRIAGRLDGADMLSSVAHVTFETGNEARDETLSRIVDLTDGRFSFSLPVPLKAEGDWTMTIREAITGREATSRIGMKTP